MDTDKEVDEILAYIADRLNKLKLREFGDLKRFARSCGLSSKNMSDFSNKYGPGSNPQFRTVYKILRILLDRKPIVIDEDDKTKVLKLIEQNLDMIKKYIG